MNCTSEVPLPPALVNVNPDTRVPVVALELTTIAVPFVTVEVPPLPPMIDKPLVFGTVTEIEADPEATLITSPVAAFVMQVEMEDVSSVEVQVGEEPVQAAKAQEAKARNARMRRRRFRIFRR